MLHNNQLISIEEILVTTTKQQSSTPTATATTTTNDRQQKQQNCHELRKFILYNRNSDLKICIYTLGAKVMSCLLNDQQIIVADCDDEDDSDYDNADHNHIDCNVNRNNLKCSTSNENDADNDDNGDNQITTTMFMDDLRILLNHSDRSNHKNRIKSKHRSKEICWSSHVYGSDTLVLNSYEQVVIDNNNYSNNDNDDCNKKQTLQYCLTKNNEFIIEGSDIYLNYHHNLMDDVNSLNNADNFHSLLINPFFFNLNSVENGLCLDEHYLQIRTSHESIEIFTEKISNKNFEDNDNNNNNHTDLNNENNNLNLANNNNNNFLSNPTIITQYFNNMDLIVWTNPSTIPDSLLIATLKYKNRFIEIGLKIDAKINTNLRILIKNGSIAFIPHNMNRFKVTYRFHW